MRVYNLTGEPLAYRGVELQPNGGSAEFAVLDQFVPNRDLELVEKKVIALRSLPAWWQNQQRLKAGQAKPARAPLPRKRVVPAEVKAEVVEEKPWKKR